MGALKHKAPQLLVRPNKMVFKWATIISKSLSLLTWITGSITAVWVYFKQKRWKEQGKKEQRLEDLEAINELRNEAEDINAEPDLTPEQQLEWMRRQNENN